MNVNKRRNISENNKSHEKKRNELIIVILYIIISLVGMLISSYMADSSYICYYLTFFSGAFLIVTILLMKRYTGEWISYYNVFIGLLYLFHMGQVVLRTIFSNYEYIKLNLYALEGKIDYVDAAIFSLRVIIFFAIGGVLYAYSNRTEQLVENNKNNHKNNNIDNYSKNNNDNNTASYMFGKIKLINHIQKYAGFIILTTLPFHLRINLLRISAMVKGTYFDTFDVQISGIESVYSKFLLIGFALYMLNVKEDKKKLIRSYILICIYFIVGTLSGGRGQAVITILFYTWLFFNLIEIKKKYIIITMLVGIVGLNFLSVISVVRDTGDINPSSIINGMFSGNNVIASTLEEFGGTLYTITRTRTEVDANVDYAMGATYIKSFANIVPDVGGLFTKMNEEAVFLNYFQSDYMGGSIIGEMYFNFGEYALIASLLLGVIMAWMSKRVICSVREERYVEFACFVPVFVNSMWWVRDYFNTMTRNVIWAIGYIVILNYIFGRREDKKMRIWEEWLEDVAQRKLRILIIPAKLHIGGAEKIATELITSMDISNYDIDFLVFGDEIGYYEPILEEKGCRIIHVCDPRKSYIKYYKDLKRINKEVGGYDVVHSHTLLNNGLNLAIFKSLGAKRLISHAHSTNAYRKDNIITRLYEMLMKFIIKKCATDYIACGKAAGNYLYGDILFSKRGVIINNGIDFGKYRYNKVTREAIRKEFGIEDEYVIANISRLDAVKNHRFLIDVFAKLLEEEPNARLLIVGEGTERENIENQIKELGIEDKVILAGVRSDIYDILNGVDIVVYPSIFEGLPVSPIEAQVNALPCVLSDTITTEIVISSDVEFLSLDSDISKWAKVILEYREKDRAKASYRRKAYEYDMKESAKKLSKIYSSKSFDR